MGSGSACMERTGTSRSCPSGPARPVAGRHVVGQPDAVGGLVEGVAGRVHGRCVHCMGEPRKRVGAMMSGLDIQYNLGDGHPLLGRRMPDLDLVTANGPLRFFTLLHHARPVPLIFGEPGGFDITPWADRVQVIDAKYVGTWELPALGAVTAPTAVVIRPDGNVAWVGDRTQRGLADALTTWFGPPAAA